MKKSLILLLTSVFIFASCSNGNNSSDNVVTYIGTKAPTVAKEVGDIVFNDGSAMPYADFAALDDDDAKTAKKAAAIALIFYKGTGLNSGTDTTTSRTLGVGLKHDKNGRAWCLDSANAYSIIITTIQCFASGSGDKDGSNNLEQIEAFAGVDDTSTAANYPAFYFAKNYSTTATNLGTAYASGWYLPSIAELFQIYACRADSTNGFDIDNVSEALGGDKFEDSLYWSSSQYNVSAKGAYELSFNYGVLGSSRNKGISYGSVCAIRAFN